MSVPHKHGTMNTTHVNRKINVFETKFEKNFKQTELKTTLIKKI